MTPNTRHCQKLFSEIRTFSKFKQTLSIEHYKILTKARSNAEDLLSDFIYEGYNNCKTKITRCINLNAILDKTPSEIEESTKKKLIKSSDVQLSPRRYTLPNDSEYQSLRHLNILDQLMKSIKKKRASDFVNLICTVYIFILNISCILQIFS